MRTLSAEQGHLPGDFPKFRTRASKSPSPCLNPEFPAGPFKSLGSAHHTPPPAPGFVLKFREWSTGKSSRPWGSPWGAGQGVQVPPSVAQHRQGTRDRRPTSRRWASLGSLWGLHRWGPKGLLSPGPKDQDRSLAVHHRGWDEAGRRPQVGEPRPGDALQGCVLRNSGVFQVSLGTGDKGEVGRALVLPYVPSWFWVKPEQSVRKKRSQDAWVCFSRCRC